jgi:hypothetical protein
MATVATDPLLIAAELLAGDRAARPADVVLARQPFRS